MGKLEFITDPFQRLYAVGDIHGCAAELEALLRHMVDQEKLSAADVVIFIGDYVDRGPDSKSVVELLLAFQRDYPATLFLKGNHEDMLLGYLGYDGSLGESYISNGGDRCLASYGIGELMPPAEALDLLSARHLSFFLELKSYLGLGGYVFAHAGINPQRGLETQLDDDLFWIRDEFICNTHNLGKTIVFGHTPYQEIVFLLPFKIGIDTGLVYGNMLSCLEFREGKILQVDQGEREVKVGSAAARSAVLPPLFAAEGR